MDTKFSFNTIDNSQMDWDEGVERRLKFLAHLVLHQNDEDQDCIDIDYKYNKFKSDENEDDIKFDRLGSISIEEAKNLIKALQFMTEGK